MNKKRNAKNQTCIDDCVGCIFTGATAVNHTSQREDVAAAAVLHRKRPHSYGVSQGAADRNSRHNVAEATCHARSVDLQQRTPMRKLNSKCNR